MGARQLMSSTIEIGPCCRANEIVSARSKTAQHLMLAEVVEKIGPPRLSDHERRHRDEIDDHRHDDERERGVVNRRGLRGRRVIREQRVTERRDHMIVSESKNGVQANLK